MLCVPVVREGTAQAQSASVYSLLIITIIIQCAGALDHAMDGQMEENAIRNALRVRARIVFLAYYLRTQLSQIYIISPACLSTLAVSLFTQMSSKAHFHPILFLILLFSLLLHACT